uniref:Uncharacterized protein n=1 Tax=Tetranychus urticae TaxID=32264 RepID=T1KIJ4_TETUR
MATEQGAIDSDSSDSNQMNRAEKQTSEIEYQVKKDLRKKIVDPTNGISPPPPQSSDSSSQQSQSCFYSRSFMHSKIRALASTTTKLQETSDIANIKNYSIACQSTKIHDQSELLTNSEMVEMKDTENGISNHGGSTSREIEL